MMNHAEMIAQIYWQACAEMRRAAMKSDYVASDKFEAVAKALENAYPEEVRDAIARVTSPSPQ